MSIPESQKFYFLTSFLAHCDIQVLLHVSEILVEGVAVNIPHAANIKGRMQYFDMGYKHIFHHTYTHTRTQPNFDAISGIASPAGILVYHKDDPL